MCGGLLNWPTGAPRYEVRDANYPLFGGLPRLVIQNGCQAQQENGLAVASVKRVWTSPPTLRSGPEMSRHGSCFGSRCTDSVTSCHSSARATVDQFAQVVASANRSRGSSASPVSGW